MALRQKWGSVVCPGCRTLVGVNDEQCLNCGRWNPGLWGFAPALSRFGRDMGFTPFVLTTCMVMYFFTLVADAQGIRSAGTEFLMPSQYSLILFGAAGTVPVFVLHHWWTILTASWLHGSFLHILFNLMWLRQLAPETAEVYGPSRMVIIYTASGAFGFLLSTMMGTGLTVGASASIFGLLAALVYYGRRGGSSAMGNQAMTYAVMLFVFGLIASRVDNWAHLGGFAGGYAASMFLDPMKPERIDHLIVALICLAVTIAAIILTFITTRPYV